MPFTPPAHTPYQWHNAPTTDTPLDAAHLETAENDLVSYTQSAIEAYDAYASNQFGPYVNASAHGISPANSASANATALAAVIGSSGTLANGGTLFCDWDGTALFDTSSTNLTPNAANLTVVGRGWGTVMKLQPEGSTNTLLPLWLLSGSNNSIDISNICLQGPNTIGAGGRNALVLHGGTGGQIRLRNVWLRHASFLVTLNATGTTTSIDASGCLFEGYGTTLSSQCVGCFEASPANWVPSKRVSVTNSRFTAFGDPAGGSLTHAVYVYPTWGLNLNNCIFDTPAATNAGYCIQHYGDTPTSAQAAQESAVVGCRFGSNIGATMGVYTNQFFPTTISACSFQNGSGTGQDIVVAGDALIEGCKFNVKAAVQSIFWFGAFTAQIADCLFTGPIGSGQGVIYLDSAGAVAFISGCRFTGATSSNGYYVLFNASGEAQIRNCRFEGAPSRAINSLTAGILGIYNCRFTTGNYCIGNQSSALTEMHVRYNDFAPTSGAAGVFSLGVTPTLLDIASNFGSVGFPTENGGTNTQTPGAVTTVNIPHGLGNASLAVTPTRMTVEPANAVTAALTQRPAVTATSTNLVLTFASALAAATAYSWNWTAAR